MGDEADVWLVDAHSERDGGDHHHAVFLNEAILIGLARGAVQSGVIRECVNAVSGQKLGRLIDGIAR